MSVETLHDNEWLSLRVVRKPDAGINGYVYSHETRCNGRIVALLPYRDTDDGREYLLKAEVTPCWGFEHFYSAITGGYEGEGIEDDAIRELEEETGYEAKRDELIPLGLSFASKSSDTVYSLFSVDLTGREAGEAVGDGSRLEAESTAVWLPASALVDVWDPQVSAMYVRLRARLDAEPSPVPIPQRVTTAIPANHVELSADPGSTPDGHQEGVTERDEVLRVANAVLAATSATLNPSPDVSGCPDTVARLAAPAVLRAYADAEHHLGEGVAQPVDYGTGIEHDAVCVCGASWGENGCTERERLLAVAAAIERGDRA
jgi:8-oxo-dGTP pyrophosphatase MutT (NUDIX family)